MREGKRSYLSPSPPLPNRCRKMLSFPFSLLFANAFPRTKSSVRDNERRR